METRAMADVKKMYVATDGDGEQSIHFGEPVFDSRSEFFTSNYEELEIGDEGFPTIKPGHYQELQLVGQPIKGKEPVKFHWQVIGDIEVCVREGYTALVNPASSTTQERSARITHDGKISLFIGDVRNGARSECESYIREQLQKERS